VPTFTYVAYTKDGKSRKGRVEGLHAKDVRETLMSEGLYAREVVELSAKSGRKLSRTGRGMFYRETAALLRAGLPLDRALELLSETPLFRNAGQMPSVVRDRVREGMPFSQALAALLPDVSGTEEAVLAAGEASGRLPEVTEELADTLDQESELVEQIRAALLYPLVVTILAVGVLGLLVGFLLPVYEELLTDMGRDLPPLTRGVLAVGRGVRHPLGVLMLIVGVLAIVLTLRRARAHPETFLSRRRFSLPVLGALWSSLVRTRFSRTLALLLEGGLQLPQAILQASAATGSAWLQEEGREMAERVSQGERFADALEGQSILGVDLPGWVRAGEASGDLVNLLRHASRSHQRAWSRGLNRALAMLEPLLIVTVGILILLVALAVLLPMIQLNQGLG